SKLSTLDTMLHTPRISPLFHHSLHDALPICVEVKSALLEKYHSLYVEQQSTVTFNELVKATVKEKVSQYEQGTQQVNELGHNHQHKDAYHDVAKQYNRIVDGLIHMFEEITRGNQTDRL